MRLYKYQEWLISLVSASRGIALTTTRKRLESAYNGNVEHRVIQAFDFSDRAVKKILCVEVGAAHDVIRPSVYRVLCALGYEIDAVLYGRRPEDRWDFFSLTPYNARRELIVDEYELLVLLNSDIIREYDFVFFNTNFVYTPDRFDSGFDYIQLLDFIHLPIKSRYGCLTIAPHPIIYKEWSRHTSWFAHLGNHGDGMLSCDYFGEDQQIKGQKENRFLISGNINSTQKNHLAVIEAARNLLCKGVSNFKIFINGSGDFTIPNELKGVMVFLNENKPPALFAVLDKVDFIISGLDSSVEWQRETYGHGTCSSAFMYSLGFMKPYIVERFFAEQFQLTDKAAIIYENGNLENAIERATRMTDDEYNSMREKISADRDRRRQLSEQSVGAAIRRQQQIKCQPILFMKTRILFILKIIKYTRAAIKHKLAGTLV